MTVIGFGEKKIAATRSAGIVAAPDGGQMACYFLRKGRLDMLKFTPALLAAAAITLAAPVLAKSTKPAAELVPVSHNVLMIMANPVPGKDAEFNTWYDSHIRDIMKLPGVIRAQRFKMLPRAGRPDPAFSYVIMYEFTGSPDALSAQMATAVKEGRLQAPDKASVLKTDGSAWQAYMPGFIATK